MVNHQRPDACIDACIDPKTHESNIPMIKIAKLRTANRFALLTLTGLLLQPLAFAQSTPPTSMGAMHAGMDMKPMMADMNEKMSSMKMTGMPDVDFAMAMRIHHQGAIQMAEAELRDGKHPQMRAMAKAIINAQKKEIAQIDRFLAKHSQANHDMGK